MPAPSHLRVWAALLTIYLVWGSTYLAIRYAVGAQEDDVGLPPLLMSGVRFALAGAVLLAVTVRRPAADGRPDPLGRAQWRATSIVGLSLLLGGNGGVVLAEDRGLDSGIVAVIVALIPLYVALIAAVRGEGGLGWPTRAGLLLGFAGVVLLINPGGGDSIEPIAAALALAAPFSWACGSYYSQRAPLPRRPLVMTGMEMLTGGAALAVAGLLRGEASGTRLDDVGADAWLAWVYLVVFGSLLAFTAYVWLLRNARLSLVTTYAYVNPVVAVLLGAAFLDEALSARTVLASGVILAGVALIVTTRRTTVPPGEEAGAGIPPNAARGVA